MNSVALLISAPDTAAQRATQSTDFASCAPAVAHAASWPAVTMCGGVWGCGVWLLEACLVAAG